MRDEEFPGKFIVVDGVDGSGTTTQTKRLADTLDAERTFEPSGNLIGEKVDEMISKDHVSPQTVALGFAADRMVHLEEEIIPMLEKGETVVCDRYYHASFAYQPVMGVEKAWVEELNRHALRPDVTVILDVSAETGMSRVEMRGRDGNVFEQMTIQEEAATRYRGLKDGLEEEIHLVDASGSKEEVERRILEKVQ